MVHSARMSEKNDKRAFHELWQRFTTEFPGEEDCLNELFRRASASGKFHCRHCGGSEVHRQGTRVIGCNMCKKTWWLTSGTFFHGIRRPSAWLGAIWLLERGAGISSYEFHKLAGVAYSTAWCIFRKLAMVVIEEIMQAVVYLSSAHFLGIICRRSRETPARLHPCTELQELQMVEPDDLQQPQIEYVDLEEISEEQANVLSLLSQEELDFDSICQKSGLKASRLSSVLGLLELEGLITALPGNRYARVRKRDRMGGLADMSGQHSQEQPHIKRALETSLQFIRGYFQGVSRKYLQHYLAIQWCQAESANWSPGTLIQACLNARSLTYKDTLEYVSPEMVALACA